MIVMPKLNEIRETTRSITKFGGINRKDGISEGNTVASKTYPLEFTDTLNMCSDDYPTIRTRDKRYRYHPLGCIPVRSVSDIRSLLKASNDTILLKENTTNPRAFVKIYSNNDIVVDASKTIKAYTIYYVITYNATYGNIDLIYTSSQITEHFIECNSENAVKTMYNNATLYSASRIYPFVAGADFTMYNEGISIKKGECYSTTLAGTYNNGTTTAQKNIAVCTWKDKEEKGEKNTKLFYNNELIRLIPQYYGVGVKNYSSGTYTLVDMYGADRLSYGAREVTAWEEGECSCFGDLKKYYSRNSINDISIASIGSYVLIAPYKAWLNTETSAIYDDTLGTTCGKVDFDVNWDMSTSTIRNTHLSMSFKYEDGTIVPACRYNWSGCTGLENELYMDGAGKPYKNVTGTKGTAFNTTNYEQVEYLRLTVNFPPSFDVKYAQTGDIVKFDSHRYESKNASSSSVIDSPFVGMSLKVVDCTVYSNYTSVDFELTGDTLTTAITNGLRKMVISAANNTDSGYENKVIYYDSIHISKYCPELRYICASNNRIWGCDNEGHELYACEQGNMRNWTLDTNEYATSMDAYTCTVGEGKEWTGCASYGGYPYFFKKDRVFRVTGNRCSNFGYTEISLNGCTDAESISPVGNYLFYMGQHGVYVYSGSTPSLISSGLDDKWIMGNGCGYNGKYFLCRKKHMANAADEVADRSFSENDPDGLNDEWELLVYDTETGMWHSEGHKRWYDCEKTPDTIYYVEDYKGVPYLYTQNKVYWAKESTEEDDFDWYAETGPWHTTDTSNNYLKQLDIHTEFEGTFDIYVKYNASEDWVLHKTVDSTERQTLNFKFHPRRCDYFRLKFAGYGKCKIYNITETYEIAREIR